MRVPSLCDLAPIVTGYPVSRNKLPILVELFGRQWVKGQNAGFPRCDCEVLILQTTTKSYREVSWYIPFERYVVGSDLFM